jgi:thermolabile hemolysin
MKKVYQIAISFLLLGAFALPAQDFTSLHIFGDGISTTTNNSTEPYYPQYYYGMRESNGRVWVEVLAQRLGLGANSITNVNWSNAGNDWSYFGQYSSDVVNNVAHFPPPPDGPTALYVLWVNCADFVNDMTAIWQPNYSTPAATNSYAWTFAINESLTNHWLIISNLYYNKGCRTLIAPNAVDITEIPAYDGLQLSEPATRNFIRQQVINFNVQYAALLAQAQASMTNLTIYEPDFFSLLDNVLTNASAYGLTNALNSQGVSADAIDNVPNAAMNGPGANYIFWDETDPTAQLHEIMADEAMQMIAPAQISGISILGAVGNPTINQLTLVNVPVGLNGFVDGSTNLGQVPISALTWTPVANINSTSLTQLISFNAPPLPPFVLPSGNGSINPGGGSSGSSGSGGATTNGVLQIYHLRFPLAWNWP